ncbi:unnamed protein product [Orchesella dallaii]|uniref:Carboxylesterase type B domain-containing protein n=1 Tax=Orchesella dallaii TaxID=48710 RepID=A0ABP1R7W4_9HEXA
MALKLSLRIFSFPKIDHKIPISVQVAIVSLSVCLLSNRLVDGGHREGHVKLKTGFANLLGTVERIEFEGFREYPFDLHYERNEVNAEYYYAFRGLKYAESPTGKLRWKDPIVKRPLQINGLYNATESGAQCPQWIKKGNQSELLGNEDCLFADIYIPVPVKKKSNGLLKLMIFFHGGGFIKNSNRDMIPEPLLLEGNAIIVMFNYRISIFGFLSTGTSELAGNYGHLDQIALLKWIQLYGRDFGGDVNDVTVFGSSIGAVSIHYLMLSKLASGLFHKAILESGSAFCERSLVPNPLRISQKLGSSLGCPSGNVQYLVSCLRSFSTEELMTAAKKLTIQFVLPTVLGPVIDKYSRPPTHQFLPNYPENLPIANKVSVISGITSDEGLTAFVFLSQEFTVNQLNNLDYIRKVILPKYLSLIMRSRGEESSKGKFLQSLTSQVMSIYAKEFLQDPILTLVGILGDLWINTCHAKMVESFCSNGVPAAYAYLFTHHDAGVSPSEIGAQIEQFHEAGINHSILDYGVAHTEEILYMLRRDTTEEIRELHLTRNRVMSEILSKLWTSFANDMPLDSATFNLPYVSWPRWNPVCRGHNYTDPDFPFYEINMNNHRTFRNYHLKESQFWWKVHQDTYS